MHLNAYIFRCIFDFAKRAFFRLDNKKSFPSKFLARGADIESTGYSNTNISLHGRSFKYDRDVVKIRRL